MNVVLSEDFKKVSKEAMLFLHKTLGLSFWYVVLYQGERACVLQSLGEYPGISINSSFDVTNYLHVDSHTDNKLHVIPNIENQPKNKNILKETSLSHGAYVSAPLFGADNKVIGSFCGLDPNAHLDNLIENEKLIEVFSVLIATVLNQTLKAESVMEDNKKLLVEANTDCMTNLSNRRAWDEALIKEEERCSRYQCSAGVLIVDLDGLKAINDQEGHEVGDKLICRAAVAIQSAVRDGDVVARVGGDEFAVLAIECNKAETRVSANRIKKALIRADVEASIGWSVRKHSSCLLSAQREADRMLYKNKNERSLTQT